ncbi:MAG: hypothetical protein COX62_03310 [Deltaproteobacteria bacterium CG_4_10_14_0_2_um_filter_43_8]|nr:MAG: hypothetical protein COV43_03855 [Deltaproteobacteria bacterium CG11_big_fil_rev_8_21_14_0_20_42_23]PJA21098.1 MAG: hypothetical protein COX62_03310 [Deltaproteobacteria bacterium CG_4_10_14_0_2_um_filter_43_8]PJC63371.1 MAG: hypothetical protein CO021_09825 [Deltaproteobacteria bacterium CG_4_9_14_0_2_um_filter_42_21]
MRTNLLEKTFESFTLGLNKTKAWLLVLLGALLTLALLFAAVWYFQNPLQLETNRTSLQQLLMQK